MATRQQRMDAFIHEGEPPADRILELLCEDHVGTYVVPFLCRWRSGDWKNVETGERISSYYNQTRTHLALRKDAPLRRSVQRSGTIMVTPILSGLHHRYARI